jgi:hypothetical protein
MAAGCLQCPAVLARSHKLAESLTLVRVEEGM